VSKSPFERIPPHSLEAERAVLGACLLDRDSLLLVTETLAGEDFYDTRHRLAFEVVLDMARKDKPVDPLTIWEEISRREMAGQAGWPGFHRWARRYRADDCQCGVPRSHRQGISTVHRRLVQVGSDIVKLGYAEDREMEDILDEAEAICFRDRTQGRREILPPHRRHPGYHLPVKLRPISSSRNR